MPKDFIVDPLTIDTDKILLDKEQISGLLEHRFEMLLLDAILSYDSDNGTAVGMKRVSDDEFWVRGHIPGRPVMPGALIIETAAQISTVHLKMTREDFKDRFIGLRGVNNVRFRKQVLPGDKLIIASQVKTVRSRSFSYVTQGFVGANMVYEGEILGIFI